MTVAGGMGKFNENLIRSLTTEATEHQAVATAAGQREEPSAGPSRRHCWVAGPREDPGPHPGLVISWRRRERGDWYAWTTWYSEAEDALVQEWLHSSALTPL